MAVALNTSSTWGDDNASYQPYQTLTTGTFSPPASSLLICVGAWNSYIYGNPYYLGIATPTNTGTARTWTIANVQGWDDGISQGVTAIWYAFNPTAQTNITVSANTSGDGYSGGGIKVYVFTGHDTSSQLDSMWVSGTTGLVSTVDGGMLVAGDTNQNSSTDLTVSTSATPVIVTAGYKTLGTAGTYSFNLSAPLSPAGVIIKAAATSSSQTVSPSGIASTVAFGTAKVNLSLSATGVASTTTFGTAVVSVASTTQTLSPSGIASTVAFGTAQLNRTVPTEGIASSNTFGTAQLNQTLTTTGIASTVAFGTASVLSSQTVTATGIASTTTFGTAQVNLSLSATGIASTTAFGTAQLNLGISLTGIASTNAFGTAQLTVFVPVTGIPSTTTFGVAQVNLGVTTVGIGSTSALGSPQLNLTIVGVGAIASNTLFGTAEVGATVPNLVGRRSSVAGSAGRTSATGATGRTTLV